jgi:hypothetical protein
MTDLRKTVLTIKIAYNARPDWFYRRFTAPVRLTSQSNIARKNG